MILIIICGDFILSGIRRLLISISISVPVSASYRNRYEYPHRYRYLHNIIPLFHCFLIYLYHIYVSLSSSYRNRHEYTHRYRYLHNMVIEYLTSHTDTDRALALVPKSVPQILLRSACTFVPIYIKRISETHTS